MLANWTVGPYERQIELPQPVNGALANTTYGNGVVVLVLPIRALGQPSVRSDFVLEVIAATRGERSGTVAATCMPPRPRSIGRSWRIRRAPCSGQRSSAHTSQA